MQRTLRPRGQVDYGGKSEEERLARRYDVCGKLEEPRFVEDQGLVKFLTGEEFTLKSIQERGLAHPVVFKDSKGLGLRAPPSSFSVSDVKRCVGARRMVDVVDTCTQEGLVMSMQQWARYFESRPRERTLNVISLEFSHSKMDSLVQAPSVVRQLDWVEVGWPPELKRAQTDSTNDMRRMMYPKVQKYCLMSVAGCYTDFHIDFGGSSVWYHILWGEKLFFLVPPSQETYHAFHTWQMSGHQDAVFFADLVSSCQLLHLQPGHTLIMPSGWIHAVYTPEDSLVFGGNFLHSFNIPQQLMVAQMEEDTKVPAKFRYPFYGTVHWFILSCYSKRLQTLDVWGEGWRREEGSGGEALPRGGKWLRCVAVNKLPIPPGSAVAEGTVPGALPGATAAEFAKPPTPPDWGTEEVALRTVKSDIALPVPSSDSKPHLSSHEREGLQMLLTSMKQDHLFGEDAPSDMPHPRELLEQLLFQLHSSAIEAVCSPQPSGVPLLTPPPQKKERRKRGSTQPSSRSEQKLSQSEHSELTELLEHTGDPPNIADSSTRGRLPHQYVTLQVTIPLQHLETPFLHKTTVCEQCHTPGGSGPERSPVESIHVLTSQPHDHHAPGKTEQVPITTPFTHPEP